MTRLRRKKNQFKKTLENLYKNIYSKNFNAEEFIAKYQTEIDSVELNEHEYAILKDKFSYNHDGKKEHTPEECIVCLEEYKKDQLLLDYPNCNHTYHFDCITTWLKEKMVCPLCKQTIRSSIIRAIVYGIHKPDIKEIKVSEGLQVEAQK